MLESNLSNHCLYIGGAPYKLCTVNVLKFLTVYSIHFIPHHTIVVGYYGFTLVLHVSVCLSPHPSVVHLSVVTFPDDNLSKCQWIFTKLAMCIDILEIWFVIADVQISSIFDSFLPVLLVCLIFCLWKNT